MKQLTVTGCDDYNFYEWQVYVNQKNEYGERRFDDAGNLTIDLSELEKIVGDMIGVPVDRLTIISTKL